ncbi:MAG: hypothetical protein JOZ96_18045 [Acidobacteria bacterium]|nr:hypothetical protein [Acidobacteriota bacterium]
MPDMLAKIYSYLLIGSGVLGLCFHAVRAWRRTPESEYSRKRGLRRKRLFRDCLHLVVGGATLALFDFGILGGWGVLILGGTLLFVAEYALALLIKPHDVRGGG